MLRKSFLAAAAVCALVATPIIAQTSKDQSSQSGQQLSAQEFTTKAASGGLFEVESSKLAQDKAKRQEVKTFAKKMIDDHTKANKELEQVAQKAGVQVPRQMEPNHKAMVDKLKNAQSGQFDQAYIQAQDQAHQESIELFRNFSKSGQNEQLKQYATKTLPVLEKHAEELKKLEQGAATGASGGDTGKTK